MNINYFNNNLIKNKAVVVISGDKFADKIFDFINLTNLRLIIESDMSKVQDVIHQNKPLVVIFDIDFYEEFWIKLIKLIIAKESSKIVIATMQDNKYIFATAFELGVVLVIPKPIDKEYFAKQIYTLCEKILENKKELAHNLLLKAIASSNATMITAVKSGMIVYFNSKFKDFFSNSCHYVSDIIRAIVDYEHDIPFRNYEELKLFFNVNAIFDGIVKIISSNKEFYFKLTVEPSLNIKDLYLFYFADITIMHEERMNVELKANTDALTGAFNKERFTLELSKKLNDFRNHFVPLALIMLDIDKFKTINDTYGHIKGDEVLIAIARTIKSHIRNDDVFSRWGGEEFTIILPNSNLTIARQRAEALRASIERLHIPEIAQAVTCSFGVTAYKEHDTLTSMLKRADSYLYIAKQSGRNRVISDDEAASGVVPTSKQLLLNKDEPFYHALHSKFIMHKPIRVFNIYKSLVISNDAFIKNIGVDFVEILTQKQQIIVMNAEGLTYIEIGDTVFKDYVLAKVSQIDVKSQLVVLQNFQSTTESPSKRTLVRVDLLMAYKAEFSYQNKLITGQIKDLSISSACVITSSDLTFERGILVRLKLFLPFIQSGMETEASILRAVPSTKDGEQKVIFIIKRIQHGERDLVKFINSKQMEIIRDLKSNMLV